MTSKTSLEIRPGSVVRHPWGTPWGHLRDLPGFKVPKCMILDVDLGAYLTYRASNLTQNRRSERPISDSEWREMSFSTIYLKTSFWEALTLHLKPISTLEGSNMYQNRRPASLMSCRGPRRFPRCPQAVPSSDFEGRFWGHFRCQNRLNFETI